MDKKERDAWKAITKNKNLTEDIRKYAQEKLKAKK